MGSDIRPNDLCRAELVGIFCWVLPECGDGAMRLYVHLFAYC